MPQSLIAFWNHIKVGLNLPENVSIYVTVAGYNNNGQNVSNTSQPFKVDPTAPVSVVKEKTLFFTNYSRFEMTTAQWDKSILRLNWGLWDLIVSVPEHCLSFYFLCLVIV